MCKLTNLCLDGYIYAKYYDLVEYSRVLQNGVKFIFIILWSLYL